MNKKLYKLMNWPEIEAIVYSEDDDPHRLLGAHNVTGGTLFQCFLPSAKEVSVVLPDSKLKMERVDEEGYFAGLSPKKIQTTYQYEVKDAKGQTKVIEDPYRFAPMITKKDTDRFNKGHHYEIYKYLGAHEMEVDGVRGILFAVWAPNAIRVSVVGDFNDWDGRVHQMRRLWDSGIFEIFIPSAKENDCYKFEIKMKGGVTFLKADPYANFSQLRPDTASIVCSSKEFTWKDAKWMEERQKQDADSMPINIYEVYLGSFARKAVKDTTKEKATEEAQATENPYYTYRELAPKLVKYVKEMGYTHIELMPIMEHPLDASWGYQVLGYYAPTSRYGTPEDFKYFMDTMHANGIGVILDWVPAHFPRDSHGLAGFDGTSLYEYADPRKGVHPHWDTLIFNYGRPEVANYLIANVLYWLNEYHVDGIRMDAVASMLYLDYGREDGQWVANMYGGKENLEAVELIKHINSIVHKMHKGVLMIAEESTAWPNVTGDLSAEGLGFDLKWNMGWMNDFLDYIRQDPLFRAGYHGELTFSMIYQYSEKFELILSHDEVVHGKSSMIGKMPGEVKDKFSNLRAAYGYMMLHPGKKLLFMGQEIGEFEEWNEEREINWNLLEYDDHKNLQKYVKALNAFYLANPALFQQDHTPDGFEWINSISANENVLVFVRKSKKASENLVVVCNFANESREAYTIGVPASGKYKEIFNSDAKEFGGSGLINKTMIASTEKEWDDREDSITFKMPALSVQVFSHTPFTKKEQAEIDRKKEVAKKRKLEVMKLNEAKDEALQVKYVKDEADARYEDAKRRVKEMENRLKEAKEDEAKMKKRVSACDAKLKECEAKVEEIANRIKEQDEAEKAREAKQK